MRIIKAIINTLKNQGVQNNFTEWELYITNDYYYFSDDLGTWWKLSKYNLKNNYCIINLYVENMKNSTHIINRK